MSRSKPTNNEPNPSTCWFEWSGSEGKIRWYNKETKEQVEVGDKFSFILLDQLASVKGWHDPSESGIFSNEVRDTRAEAMVVKTFSGQTIAEGFYKENRDKIAAAGGKFTANLYIAYKDGEELKIGSLQFSGAALNAWVDFSRACRKEVYEKAIVINGSDEGKKGRVVFRTPKFSTIDISSEKNEKAIALDQQLQTYLEGYFKRTHVDKVSGTDALPGEPDYNQERPSRPGDLDQSTSQYPTHQEPTTEPEDDDLDIPF